MQRRAPVGGRAAVFRYKSYDDYYAINYNQVADLSRLARLLGRHDLLKGLQSGKPPKRLVYHHVESIFERRLLGTEFVDLRSDLLRDNVPATMPGDPKRRCTLPSE
jgi:hypothetical protein